MIGESVAWSDEPLCDLFCLATSSTDTRLTLYSELTEGLCSLSWKSRYLSNREGAGSAHSHRV